MATYNGEKYIYTQLESILCQLGEKDEVIISDDSSTDKTLEIIGSFKDERIKIHKYNTYYNPIFNFENALKNASGDIIFLSDQDDVWEENKVASVVELMSEYDVIVSDCKVIDNNGVVIQESFFRTRNSGKGFWKNLYKCTYLGCCMAFGSRILKLSLPFPSNIPMHDLWIGTIGELYGRVKFCDQKLIKFRRHGSNHTNTAGRSPYAFRKKLQFRINLFFCLIHRMIELIMLRERNQHTKKTRRE
jgi:glycosyltransferase involved in cell wall biosynthesis